MGIWAEGLYRLIHREPWEYGSGGITLIVIGAGFSAGVGLPVGEELLRRAATCSDERIRRLTKELQTMLKEKQGILSDPLLMHSEDLFAAILGREDPSISIYGVRLDRVPQEARQRFGLFRALLLVHYALLTDEYDQDIFPDSPNFEWGSGLPPEYLDFCASLPRHTHVITTNFDDVIERSLFAANREWTYGVPIYFHYPFRALKYKRGGATIKMSGREDNIFYIVRPLFDDLPEVSDQLVWARGDWRPPVNLVRLDPKELLRETRSLRIPIPLWGALGKAKDPLIVTDHIPVEIVLCRLNGSVRWVECGSCKRTYSVGYWGAHPLGHFLGDFEIPDDEDLAFACWDSNCPSGRLLNVVAPTPSRRLCNGITRRMWGRAMDAANKAGKIVVVGSSLRERGLLTLLQNAARQVESITIVNQNYGVAKQAEKLFGRPVKFYEGLRQYVESGELRVKGEH